jgi:hypothetical protein
LSGRVSQNLWHQEEQVDGKITKVWDISSNLHFLLLSLLQEENF